MQRTAAKAAKAAKTAAKKFLFATTLWSTHPANKYKEHAEGCIRHAGLTQAEQEQSRMYVGGKGTVESSGLAIR